MTGGSIIDSIIDYCVRILIFPTAVYLEIAFIRWDLLWVKQIPNYSDADRSLMLLATLLNVFCYIVYILSRYSE